MIAAAAPWAREWVGYCDQETGVNCRRDPVMAPNTKPHVLGTELIAASIRRNCLSSQRTFLRRCIVLTGGKCVLLAVQA